MRSIMIVSGAAIGAIFGWIVLSLSVVSLPMLVDCDVSAAGRTFHADVRNYR